MRWFVVEGEEWLKRHSFWINPIPAKDKSYLLEYIRQNHLLGDFNINEITEEEATLMITKWADNVCECNEVHPDEILL